jgi:hypothetical protein
MSSHLDERGFDRRLTQFNRERVAFGYVAAEEAAVFQGFEA